MIVAENADVTRSLPIQAFPQRITVDHLTYRLQGVVLGNGRHFKSSFVVRRASFAACRVSRSNPASLMAPAFDGWVEYDGIGNVFICHPTPPALPDGYRVEVFLYVLDL